MMIRSNLPKGSKQNFKKRVSYLLLIFLIFSSFYAQGVAGGHPAMSSAIFLISITVFGVALLLIILLLFARFFQSTQMEQVFKAELVFALSTLLLAVFLIILVDSIQSFLFDAGFGVMEANYKRIGVSTDDLEDMKSYFIGAQGRGTVIDLALFHMKAFVDCGMNIMDITYSISIIAEASASVYSEQFMSEVASGFLWNFVIERLKNTTSIMTFFFVVYYLLVYILSFIKETYALFLALGLLLRSFPPTRGAGAYVLSFTIGLYLVFPVIYVFAAGTTNVPVCLTGKLDADSFKFFDPCVTDPQFSIGFNFQSSMWLVSKFPQVMSFIKSISFEFFEDLMSNLCLFPLVAITITLSFVLSSTSLFGGSIPEVGRGLIKLL